LFIELSCVDYQLRVLRPSMGYITDIIPDDVTEYNYGVHDCHVPV
jgi:hypothetical protein